MSKIDENFHSVISTINYEVFFAYNLDEMETQQKKTHHIQLLKINLNAADLFSL